MEAEALESSGKIQIGYSPQNIRMMKVKVEFLRKIFDLNVDIDFSITTDKKDINKIKKRDKEIMEVFLENEVFCEVLAKKEEKQ